ncbi:hypothetical protein MMC07_005314 [Pseudocyphellaria aurata]|nr:hypothetical protein [Pseudocyphellaria aurata]
MPHSPVTKVFYACLSREELENYRGDIAEFERRDYNGEDMKELPGEVIFVARMLLQHAEFLEDKLEAKINAHNRELKKLAKQHDELKSEIMHTRARWQ